MGGLGSLGGLGSIPGVMGGVAPPLVLDNFTDTNATALDLHTPDRGGPWTIVSGTPTIQSNKASSGPTKSTIAAAANVTITCNTTVYGGGPSGNGLIFRYQDTDNYLWAGVDLLWQRPVMYKVIAGVGTEIGLKGTFSESWANNAAVAMQIVTLGTSLKLYLDTVLKIDITESSLSTATICGLYADQVGGTTTWDVFKIVS